MGTGIPAHPCNLLPNYAIAVLFIGSLCVDLLRWGRSRESGRWRWGVHALVRPGEMVAHFAELAFLEAIRSLADQIFEGVVVENLK